MRISGGGARGIPLLVPKGDAVRPATDGLRQAVFSSLASRVPGARFPGPIEGPLSARESVTANDPLQT